VVEEMNKPGIYQVNPRLQALTCLRCGARYELHDPRVDQGLGCTACLQQGYPVSLRLEYRIEEGWRVEQAAGMFRFRALLPYHNFPTLGEGSTPLVELRSLARTLGVAKLWVKNEGQNPTGSHKDRMSPLAVARAAALGRDTVVAASSGNAGASLAAYAAAAGLRCVIYSTARISKAWRQAIEITGAELVIARTPEERWVIMQQRVREQGWYPVTNFLDPPVGSNPFGVDGYKTVAYEILEACGDNQPTVIFIPTARGDLLWGIWQGLQDGKQNGLCWEMPRLFAVEPAPRLSRVLAGEDYRQPFEEEPHAMISIGGSTVTYQSVSALRDSHGGAVEVPMEKAELAQHELARQGIYAELSAAASLAGLKILLKQGQIRGSDRVVLIITSHGFKDPPIPEE
jgi:threonine synthase